MKTVVLDTHFWKSFFASPKVFTALKETARITMKQGLETGFLGLIDASGRFYIVHICKGGCSGMAVSEKILKFSDECEVLDIPTEFFFDLHFHPTLDEPICPSVRDLYVLSDQPFIAVAQVSKSGYVSLLIIKRRLISADPSLEDEFGSIIEEDLMTQEEVIQALEKIGYSAVLLHLGRLQNPPLYLKEREAKKLELITTKMQIPETSDEAEAKEKEDDIIWGEISQERKESHG